MKLKKFKRQVAYAAVAGVFAGVGMVGSAQAVNVNPDGLGQVLMFPYYTVRNNQATVFSVVNTTSVGKAVKVRFLEGKNSQEVLDFNLYLSPNDVWAASITATADGAKVSVSSTETSCTAPVISTGLGGSGSEDFRNSKYSADATTDHGLDRTREGYFEVIEMGVVNNAFVLTGTSTFGQAITHVGGVLTAAKCGQVTTAWAAGTLPGANSVSANTGGLAGSAHIIGLSEGTDISYEPTVLDAWSNLGNANHFVPGSENPSLGAVSPATSTVFNNGTSVTSFWIAQIPIDPVSAVLMHSALDNEYVTAVDLAAGTDWVVTFPTKRFHVNSATTLRPFTLAFAATGSCDTVTPTIFDREEQVKGGTIDFSPSTTPTTTLCWEANVIRFGSNANADVLKSTGISKVIANSSIFTNGWMRLSFPSDAPVATTGVDAFTYGVAGANGIDDAFEVMANSVHQMYDTQAAQNGAAAGAGFRYQGLPAIGFAVTRFSAGSSSALANYGASFMHKGERLITPAP
jgi:hypothetical protein